MSVKGNSGSHLSLFFVELHHRHLWIAPEFFLSLIHSLLAKRINNAKELLRYSNSSIEEIAHLCGIDDASYFNKVFRKMEGCTASEYRKRW